MHGIQIGCDWRVLYRRDGGGCMQAKVSRPGLPGHNFVLTDFEEIAQLSWFQFPLKTLKTDFAGCCENKK